MKRSLIFLVTILLGISTGFTQTSWNMPPTGTDTIRTCSGFIYDSGGPEGNYSFSELGTMVIYPAEGNSGTFTISGVYEFADYGGGTLTIYDGVGFTPTTTPLGRYSGTGNIPVLTSTTSAFTVNFKSSAWANPLSGFKLNVSCINCFSAATHLNSSNITLTSADISWNTNGIIPQSWQYVYGPKGSNPVLLTPIATTDSTVTLTDLEHSSAYDVWVRAVCGPNDYSLWSPLFSFRTLCGEISVLPYIENFDSYDSVRVAVPGVFPFPPCWHKNRSAVSGYPALVNTSCVSSPASLKFSLSPTGMRTSYVTTPPIDTSVISMDEIKVNFDIQPNSNTAIQIGVMIDPADTSTFTLVQTFTPSAITEWQSVEVPFNHYTGTGRYLAIRMELNSNSSAEVLIDDFEIGSVSSCMAPSELFVSNITPFTAQFSWTPNNNETSWEISIVQSGDGPDDEGLISVQDNPSYILTNLTPDSEYAVYVRAICGEESSGDWVATPFVFSTTCPVYEAPFTETFNDLENRIPPCWKQYTGLASQVFSHLAMLVPQEYGPWSLTDGEGLPAKHMKVNVYGENRKHWLVTPSIDISHLGAPALMFDLALTDVESSNPLPEIGDYEDDQFMVIISTDGGNSWLKSNATIWNNSDTANYVYRNISHTGQEVIIPLLNYLQSGETIIKIAFYAESTVDATVPFGGDVDLHIDNVSVGEIPTCFKPTQTTVSNITTDSVLISWNRGANENKWILECVLEDETPFLTDTVLIDTFYRLTGLTDATTYKIRLKSVCSDTDQSLWINYINFQTTCFNIISADLPLIENFDTYGYNTGYGDNNYPIPACWTRWSVDQNQYPAIVNTTAQSVPAALDFEAFDGINMISTNQFDPNIALNTLQISFSLLDRNYWMFSTFYIGTVADPNDLSTFAVVDSVICSARNVWELFEIPLNQYMGTNHYIAFKLVEGSVLLDDLTIESIPTCKKPDNLTVTNMTKTSATLAWNERNSATSWTIEYGTEGFDLGEGTVVSVDSNPATLTGLTAGTYYEFYVKSNCSVSDTSNWSLMGSFSTVCEAIALPYTENFDSYVGTDYDQKGVMPDCWNTVTNNTVYSSHIMDDIYTMFYSAPNALGLIAGENGDQSYAVFPEFSTPLNSLKISFYRTMEDVNEGVLTIGYATNPVNMNTYTIIDTIPSVEEMQNITFDLGEYTDIPANGNIVLLWNAPETYICYLDNVLVERTAICANPANLQITGITTNEAVVSWDAGRDETVWILEYKTASDANYTVINIQNTPLDTLTGLTAGTLTGLTAGTAYDIRVKSVCDVDFESEYTSSNFNTLAQFIITASAGNGGSIEPSGDVIVVEGNSQPFVMTPDANYRVRYVEIDQENAGALTSYTFQNVLANHTIHAEFITTGTGIENRELQNSVQLYPNPAESFMMLNIDNTQLTVKEAGLYDIYGKLIQMIALTDYTATVQVRDLSSGVYFIRVISDQGMITKKFVKK